MREELKVAMYPLGDGTLDEPDAMCPLPVPLLDELLTTRLQRGEVRVSHTASPTHGKGPFTLRGEKGP
jgi:hypothetical protein